MKARMIKPPKAAQSRNRRLPETPMFTLGKNLTPYHSPKVEEPQYAVKQPCESAKYLLWKQ
jgi:hypothetical protein